MIQVEYLYNCRHTFLYLFICVAIRRTQVESISEEVTREREGEMEIVSSPIVKGE